MFGFVALVVIAILSAGLVWYYKRPREPKPAPPRRYTHQELQDAEHRAWQASTAEVRRMHAALLEPKQRRIVELQREIQGFDAQAQKEFEDFSYLAALAGTTNRAAILAQFEAAGGGAITARKQALEAEFATLMAALAEATSYAQSRYASIQDDARQAQPELRRPPLREQTPKEKAAWLKRDRELTQYLAKNRPVWNEQIAFAKFQAELNAQGITDEDEIHARFVASKQERGEALAWSAPQPDHKTHFGAVLLRLRRIPMVLAASIARRRGTGS